MKSDLLLFLAIKHMQQKRFLIGCVAATFSVLERCNKLERERGVYHKAS